MSKINKSLMSSASAEWATPQFLFDQLNQEFAFTLDVCSTHENAKCEKYFTIEDNGLEQSWGRNVCWMNPPYGKAIAAWIDKAIDSDNTVVCLVPARTDTVWFQKAAENAEEIRFIKGRLKFGGHKDAAPFPSAIIVLKSFFDKSVGAPHISFVTVK